MRLKCLCVKRQSAVFQISSRLFLRDTARHVNAIYFSHTSSSPYITSIVVVVVVAVVVIFVAVAVIIYTTSKFNSGWFVTIQHIRRHDAVPEQTGRCCECTLARSNCATQDITRRI